MSYVPMGVILQLDDAPPHFSRRVGAFLGREFTVCWIREGQHIPCPPSVGIALGYGLDDRGSRVRFPAGAGSFSLQHCVRTRSGAHPSSYPMGTRGSFLGVKAAGS
jgi:hypothetical protein